MEKIMAIVDTIKGFLSTIDFAEIIETIKGFLPIK